MRAFRIAYDGRPYHGFQRQPSVPTVEDAILDALRDLDVLASADETHDDGDGMGAGAVPSEYAAAGRTDAGVSAIAQTIAFECPDWLTPRAFNGQLPSHVRAYASTDVPPDFHATYDAESRAYDYHLFAPAADPERAAAALERLEGTHDFGALTARSDDEDTVRTIQTAGVTASESPGGEGGQGILRIHLRADGFLWELVRRIVTLVHAVATGDRPLSTVDDALDPGTVPDHERVGPAPPEPLVLSDVTYPDVAFERDDDAAASAHAVFSERYGTAVARSAVTRQLEAAVEDD